MKKSSFFALAFICFFSSAFAQTNAKYFEYINQAKNSFEKKDYKRASVFYANAFKLNPKNAFQGDRYNAARSWALTGNKDSAFSQLFTIVTYYDYTDYKQISEDTSFNQMHTDKRWKQITNVIGQNVSNSNSSLNSGLVLLLDSVYRNYYSYRLVEVRIKNELGADADEMNGIKKIVRQKDSINLSIVTSTIDKYGWLGKDVVGFIGNYALAMMLQHADTVTQQKYLPLAREAFKSKSIEAYDLALFEDYALLKKGKPQLYGTVIVNLENKNYIAPIEDVENVDKRRATLGLKPIREYLINYGIKWDLTDYKKDLLLLEKEKIEY